MAAALVLAALLAADAAPGTARPGPTPGLRPQRLVAAWSVPSDRPVQAFETGPYAFSDAAVVMPGASGVDLRDPRTGAVRAAIPAPPGHRVADAGFVQGVLVLHHEDKRSARRVLAGYDPRTGAELWRTAVPDPQGEATGDNIISSGVMLTPLTVTAVTADKRQLVGFDPLTGRERWRHTLAAGCDIFVDAGPVTQLGRRCADGHWNFTTIDAATGRVIWQRAVTAHPDDPVASSAIAADDGRTLVTTGDVSRLYAPGGRLLREFHLKGEAFGIDGNAIAVDAGENRLAAVDAATGAPLWAGDGSQASGSAERGILLPLRRNFPRTADWYGRDPQWPMPYFVTLVNPGDGSMRSLPIAAGDGGTDLLGMAQDVVFAYHHTQTGGRVTAYRLTPPAGPGPEELAGVPAAAWPDACAPLPLAAGPLAGLGYRAYPRTRRLDATAFPHPVSCDLVPPGDHDPVITLRIDWVAPSEEEAVAVLDSVLAGYRSDQWPVKRLAEGLYQVPGFALDLTPDTVLIRSGPVLARLITADDPRLVRRLAPLVQAAIADIRQASSADPARTRSP
ncbi:outer membrane protein assembly factor BamB family protein [Nonomuraea aurantiaca]|uniref:outer membrane protein assembly factor BamB family protein n=1 Tax=Nonomuraea aurantiaca TaxID=2878562 RepID=UPI001CD95117|nr:PQQ-binding-like beta-propeller repeat protein [Nonomuraea aurantiaca]MCA2226782.1 PQQ-like beta-propeller repeat protein [Nonomuraea aurantiaca]